MKNLVVLTGAGMSAESGISTFRDAGGLWDKYPVEQVATPEGYADMNCWRNWKRISMWRLSHRMWIICTNGQEAAISFTCMVS